jgi:hypothetical protein
MELVSSVLYIKVACIGNILHIVRVESKTSGNGNVGVFWYFLFKCKSVSV